MSSGEDCASIDHLKIVTSEQARSRRATMPIKTKYVFIVSMDVTPEKEALFNEVYDTEHVPYLSKVPGVLAATRFKTEPAAFVLSGEKRELKGEGLPRYVAVYEIES